MACGRAKTEQICFWGFHVVIAGLVASLRSIGKSWVKDTFPLNVDVCIVPEGVDPDMWKLELPSILGGAYLKKKVDGLESRRATHANRKGAFTMGETELDVSIDLDEPPDSLQASPVRLRRLTLTISASSRLMSQWISQLSRSKTAGRSSLRSPLSKSPFKGLA